MSDIVSALYAVARRVKHMINSIMKNVTHTMRVYPGNYGRKSIA